MEERVEGRMKGSEGERWVTPSPALRTRGIRTSGMIRHSVAFRAEQQRETSRPLPGTPSVEEQDTGPYGLVDASYLYEDCYKSQEDDIQWLSIDRTCIKSQQNVHGSSDFC